MTDPDARFSLANERTFLAYERTAIALVAAGLAVFHLLDPGWAEALLGAVLLLSGALTAVAGWARFRQAQRAIESGERLDAGFGVPLVTAAVLVCVVVAALTVVV